MLLLLFSVQGGGPAGGNPKAFEDLTTVYTAHVAVLHAANPTQDLTSLASKDLATVRAASVSNTDDLNNALAEYLLSNN